MTTQERVRGLFEYNPDTGKLTNRVNRKQSRAGEEAGSFNSKGARRVKIDNCEHLVHRLIWLYVYGKFPNHQVDHVNGNPSDNRIANLREATSSENNQNRRQMGNNTSGYRGVTKHKQTGKWQACICAAGRAIYLGLFTLPEQAHAAYLAAKAEMHPFQPTLRSQ